jgi:hypothetical protein
MKHPLIGNTVFKRSNAASKRFAKPATQLTIYRPRVRPGQGFVCDRCADDDAPIAGVIIMPDADQAQLFCGRCFGRTSIIRRTHPEWSFFEVAGPATIEELAATLASQGFVPSASSSALATTRRTTE